MDVVCSVVVVLDPIVGQVDVRGVGGKRSDKVDGKDCPFHDSLESLEVKGPRGPRSVGIVCDGVVVGDGGGRNGRKRRGRIEMGLSRVGSVCQAKICPGVIKGSPVSATRKDCVFLMGGKEVNFENGESVTKGFCKKVLLTEIVHVIDERKEGRVSDPKDG
jgi:hypothetical protein